MKMTTAQAKITHDMLGEILRRDGFETPATSYSQGGGVSVHVEMPLQVTTVGGRIVFSAGVYVNNEGKGRVHLPQSIIRSKHGSAKQQWIGSHHDVVMLLKHMEEAATKLRASVETFEALCEIITRTSGDGSATGTPEASPAHATKTS